MRLQQQLIGQRLQVGRRGVEVRHGVSCGPCALRATMGRKDHAAIRRRHFSLRQ
jgi:hypothetical protein